MQNRIRNMSFEDYRQIERMNASTLVKGFRRGRGTMRSLKRALDGGRDEPTKALQFGNKYHSLILEPFLFAEAFVVMPNFAAAVENVDAKGNPSLSWATKFCKESKASFDAAATMASKEVITRDEYDRGLAMRNAIAEKTRAMELLRLCDKEVTLLGDIDGVPFKCRLDLLGPVIADLKGARSVAEIPFGGDAARLGYGFKLAIYREVARQVTGDLLPVEIIAVESDGDFDTVVYEVPEQVLDDGLEFVRETINEMKQCQSSGVWPGADRGETTLPLYWPNWAMRNENDVLDWSDIYE